MILNGIFGLFIWLLLVGCFITISVLWHLRRKDRETIKWLQHHTRRPMAVRRDDWLEQFPHEPFEMKYVSSNHRTQGGSK